MKNYRIVKRVHRIQGTWFVIQKKFMFAWFDLPCVYREFDDAVLDLMENHGHIKDDVEEKVEVDLGV